MIKTSIYFVLFWLSFVHLGCVHKQIHGQVNAISGVRMGPAKIFVVCTNRDGSVLEQDRFKSLVEASLARQGHEISSKFGESNVVVAFNYGVASKDVLMTESVYNWVPSQSYSYSGTTSGPGGSYYTSGVLQPQSYGQMQYGGQRNYVQTVHNKMIFFKAFDAEELREMTPSGQEPKPIWETFVSSANAEMDMRRIFPVLTVMGAGFFGQDTGGSILIRIDESDPQIFEVINRSLQRQSEASLEGRGPASELP